MTALHPIFAQIFDAHIRATKAVTPKPPTYRGWQIDRDFLDHWRAVHPGFDGESNTTQITEATRERLFKEIDIWIAENEA